MAIKDQLKEVLFNTLRQPPLENLAVASSLKASPDMQRWLRKAVPQPYSYTLQDQRIAERYGYRWTLNPKDYFQWHQFYGLYDEVLEVLRATAASTQVIFDIGANIGFYSLLMARAQGPTGRVFSFEPNPETYSRLVTHIEDNAADKVQATQLGFSDSKGRLKLYEQGEGEAGKYSLRPPEGGNSKVFEVEITTLDDRFRLLGLDRLDLIKIDVEGFEPEVMLGGKETISKYQPYMIFEFTPVWMRNRKEKTNAAIDVLKKAGYLFHHLLPSESGPPQTTMIDIDSYLAARYDQPGNLNLIAQPASRPPLSRIGVTGNG